MLRCAEIYLSDRLIDLVSEVSLAAGLMNVRVVGKYR